MTVRAPAAPRAGFTRQPVSWTRLAWVTWRQHRAGLTGSAVLLGILSVYMLIMGLQINRAYDKFLNCHPAGTQACQQLKLALQQYWGGGGSALQSGGVQTISSLLLILPVLLGVFTGAPLIARELESGTFRFAWTQGCGRTRWVVAKLALLAGVLTSAAWAFSMLFSWYTHPFIADHQVSELLPLEFGVLGVAFAAWTLAAFSIGAFAGTVIRRTVPAMAASLAGWIVLDLATAIFIRQHYQTPLTISGSSPPAGNSAWVLTSWYTGPNGKPVSPATIGALMSRAPARIQKSPNQDAWLSLHHYTQWWSYQPENRFWHFQYIEGGWLLALSVILIAATIWLVRRRAI